MSGLTTSGFAAKTLTEILDSVKARLRSSFGSAVDTNTDSVIMVTLNPVLLEVEELWQGAQGQYDFLNKNNSEGVPLDNIGAIINVPRLAGTSSVVDVDVTGTAATVIPAGTIRSVEDTNEPFQTLIDYTLPASGSQPYSIEMSALNDGPIPAVAGTLNQGSLPSGVTIMTNPTDATLGTDDETDEAYRIGMGTRLAAIGNGTVIAIKAAISSVDGVTAVTVLENDTNTTDSDGLPPHSIRALVSGTYTNQDVIDALGENKGAGTFTDGTIPGTYTDPVDGQEFDINFSSPAEISMYVSVVVTSSDATFPATGLVDVKNAIIAEGLTFELGDDVILPRLQSAVTSVPGIVSYTLFFATTATPVTDTTVTISNSEIADFDTADISVT